MKVVTRIPIKKFNGKTVGYIEDDGRGNQQARTFYGKILGSYIKSSDMTKDFYGRIVGKGNLLSALLWDPAQNPAAQN